MSRPLRIQYPGACYHVMNRGLNRARIFLEDAHYQKFLSLLNDINLRYKVEIHAYCLMDNHYHLIIHTPEGNLSRAMRHLDGVYTQYFNRHMRRDGPLFRGRYKSILIEAEIYLLSLSRYIHLNPTEAKLCVKPEEYKWSSYAAYLQLKKCPTWLCCEEVLARCSEKLSIKKYQTFVEENMSANDDEYIFSGKQLPIFLGTKNWIENIKKQFLMKTKVDIKQIPSAKCILKTNTAEQILYKVVEYYDISLPILIQHDNKYKENRFRNNYIYVAVMHIKCKIKMVAIALGNISEDSVSRILKRVQGKLSSDLLLQREIQKLKEFLSTSDFLDLTP